LAKHNKDVVGISVKIDVGDPGSVARSEGKAKRVVDKRERA
jgi:phenylacetate-CoA ligase